MTTNIKNNLELIMEELDNLRHDVEPMLQSELGELDKRILLDTLSKAAQRADDIWHVLYSK